MVGDEGDASVFELSCSVTAAGAESAEPFTFSAVGVVTAGVAAATTAAVNGVSATELVAVATGDN